MLRRITLGLMLQGATLKNGKPVQSMPDAIRFMLEKLIADVKQRNPAKRLAHQSIACLFLIRCLLGSRRDQSMPFNGITPL
ncbi:hypothetical protein JXA32_11465 [Candidatus Sumerlaeota bacterium]|nr:hypothetical protein [Candidatus Sumerlaeota bacterium]